MAIFYPPIDIINTLRVAPTGGEKRLLTFLETVLDNTYEVYFQSFLNGDNPDIIVMRRGSGIMFIEVKDWDLDCYYIDASTKWRLASNDKEIRSPFEQVKTY